jgi:hypothetical protein
MCQEIRQYFLLIPITMSQPEVGFDLDTPRKASQLRLGFTLDICPRQGDQDEQSQPPHRCDIAIPDDAESAANSVLPELTELIPETADLVQSANVAAENVAAYYAPLGRTLELVDRLLNVVSDFAEVSTAMNENTYYQY